MGGFQKKMTTVSVILTLTLPSPLVSHNSLWRLALATVHPGCNKIDCTLHPAICMHTHEPTHISSASCWVLHTLRSWISCGPESELFLCQLWPCGCIAIWSLLILFVKASCCCAVPGQHTGVACSTYQMPYINLIRENRFSHGASLSMLCVQQQAVCIS